MLQDPGVLGEPFPSTEGGPVRSGEGSVPATNEERRAGLPTRNWTVHFGVREMPLGSAEVDPDFRQGYGKATKIPQGPD